MRLYGLIIFKLPHLSYMVMCIRNCLPFCLVLRVMSHVDIEKTLEKALLLGSLEILAGMVAYRRPHGSSCDLPQHPPQDNVLEGVDLLVISTEKSKASWASLRDLEMP